MTLNREPAERQATAGRGPARPLGVEWIPCSVYNTDPGILVTGTTTRPSSCGRINGSGLLAGGCRGHTSTGGRAACYPPRPGADDSAAAQERWPTDDARSYENGCRFPGLSRAHKHGQLLG